MAPSDSRLPADAIIHSAAFVAVCRAHIDMRSAEQLPTQRTAPRSSPSRRGLPTARQRPQPAAIRADCLTTPCSVAYDQKRRNIRVRFDESGLHRTNDHNRTGRQCQARGVHHPAHPQLQPNGDKARNHGVSAGIKARPQPLGLNILRNAPSARRAEWLRRGRVGVPSLPRPSRYSVAVDQERRNAERRGPRRTAHGGRAAAPDDRVRGNPLVRWPPGEPSLCGQSDDAPSVVGRMKPSVRPGLSEVWLRPCQVSDAAGLDCSRLFDYSRSGLDDG
jgi:hypothetical protein